MAHAIAPAANIMLVEANSDSVSDLLAAVAYGAAHANVVSMSWGASEFSGETTYDSDFDESGVAFVASAGDDGGTGLMAVGVAERFVHRWNGVNLELQ